MPLAGSEASFRAVNVLALTIFISSCLAGIFICCFAIECRRSRHRSLERDSLLPLCDSDHDAAHRK